MNRRRRSINPHKARRPRWTSDLHYRVARGFEYAPATDDPETYDDAVYALATLPPDRMLEAVEPAFERYSGGQPWAEDAYETERQRALERANLPVEDPAVVEAREAREAARQEEREKEAALEAARERRSMEERADLISAVVVRDRVLRGYDIEVVTPTQARVVRQGRRP